MTLTRQVLLLTESKLEEDKEANKHKQIKDIPGDEGSEKDHVDTSTN